jgi:hypothetical protein
MSGYNGWKNWATWNFALWHLDHLQDSCIEMWADGQLQDVQSIIVVAGDYWDEIKDSGPEQNGVGWLGDVIDAYTDEVDFREIAEHIWDACQEYEKS